MTLLLLYTAIFVPYKTAFLDSLPEGMVIFEYIIDSLFVTDIIVNFFSAYHGEKNVLIVDRCKIAKSYLKSWFLLDVIAWYFQFHFTIFLAFLFNSLSQMKVMEKEVESIYFEFIYNLVF